MNQIFEFLIYLVQCLFYFCYGKRSYGIVNTDEVWFFYQFFSLT